MTELEKAIVDIAQADFYLQDVSTEQFILDCREVMAAYSDNGVIDRAIELLASCRTKED